MTFYECEYQVDGICYAVGCKRLKRPCDIRDCGHTSLVEYCGRIDTLKEV